MITILLRNKEENAEVDSLEFPGGFGSRICGQIGDCDVHKQPVTVLNVYGPSKGSAFSKITNTIASLVCENCKVFL